MNGQFDFGEITPIKYFLGIGFVLACLFWVIDDDGLAWHLRFLQWQFQVLLPIIILIFTQLALDKIDAFRRLNSWVKLIISGLIGCIIFVPFALQLDIWLGNESLEARSYSTALLQELFAIALPITASWCAINAPWVMGFKIVRAGSQEQTITSEKVNKDDDNSVKAKFLQLVPDNIRGDVIYLKSELHYLKVQTTKGKALILYNLKDAIAELPTDSGLQTHRSYWVTKKYIQSFTKKGREGILTLEKRPEVPVSRARVETVKALVN